MKLTLLDLIRLHLESVGVVDVLLLAVLAAELVAILLGLVGVLRRHGNRRWCRAAVSLGIVGVVLSVLALAMGEVRS